MTTKLKIDLRNGVLEVEGEEAFVKAIYQEHKASLVLQQTKSPAPAPAVHNDSGKSLSKGATDAKTLADYASLGDLFAELENPKDLTDKERVLLAAAYIQMKGNGESFESHSTNKELGHAGYKSTNITRDITNNMTCKPALIAQLRKSGSSRQAHKIYKVTSEGFKSALALLAGTSNGE